MPGRRTVLVLHAEELGEALSRFYEGKVYPAELLWLLSELRGRKTYPVAGMVPQEDMP